MFRQRCFGILLLAMAMTVAACDSGPFEPGSREPLTDDGLAAVLALGPAADEAREVRSHPGGAGSVLEQLAAKIPGFGGLYRLSHCVVAVVLTEGANVQEAVRIVHATIEPLVAQSCRTGIRVEPVRGIFSFDELQGFLRAARPLSSIPGVVRIHIDFSLNRLVFVVESRRTADAVLAALPGAGIPERAVVFQARRDSTTVRR